jgi:pre-mRNA-splicing helicase BRR2
MQVDLKLLQKGNLIMATAEHWDRVSRRWRRQKAISDIALFIVDELHLLGSEGGPALEVVVSRMRAISKLLEKPIRMVGLGASMADGKEVGEWLGVPSHAQFTFPPSVRPVPLEIHIQSMDIPSFEARMQARRLPASPHLDLPPRVQSQHHSSAVVLFDSAYRSSNSPPFERAVASSA